MRIKSRLQFGVMVYYLRVPVLTPEKGTWENAPIALLGEMLHSIVLHVSVQLYQRSWQ